MLHAVVERAATIAPQGLPHWRTKRREERVPSNVAANLRKRGAALKLRFEVMDLSSDGCRIAGGGYAPGEEVVLSLAFLSPMGARVVWSTGEATGLQFSVRLHPAVVEHLSAT